MLAVILPLGSTGFAAIGSAHAQSLVTAIVSDPLTGLALGGMDPVSYFTEAAPLRGRGEFEHVWQNVTWYFATAANRDIFAKAPEIYAPRFGGHSAMAAARGFVADGDPAIYLVFKQRLYLFYSAATREAFLMAPDAAAMEAETNWTNLSRQLSVN